MEIIKENFEKFESTHGIYLSYMDKDEEGNWDVFYKQSKVKTILYMENSIVDKLDDIDYELYYGCHLDGIIKVYYKDGSIDAKEITACTYHHGRESYYHKQDISDENKNIFENLIHINSRLDDNNEVICDLEKIELYWTYVEIEISEYECSHCRCLVELRSDELNCCQNCCCDCCECCLIHNDYLEMYVCPECDKEINEEFNEEVN